MIRSLLVVAAWSSVFLPAAEARPSASDGLEELVRALGRFRGIGEPGVVSYRVPLLLPEEPGEPPVPLVEIWRAPGHVALRAGGEGVSAALVRSLAIYLEPLYVARSALLEADLADHLEAIRASAEISVRGAGGGRSWELLFAEEPSAELPEFLRDVSRVEAHLDEHGRLVRLGIRTRGEEQGLLLHCLYDEQGREPLPRYVSWTLPGGGRVEVRTEFRTEGGRTVPAARHIVFPSRYEPGSTEEIHVRYGEYDFDVGLSGESFTGPGVFCYGPEGLLAD